MYQLSFKWVSMMFKRFNGCFRKFSNVFQGCFREDLRVSQARLRGAPRDSRELQGYLKEVQILFHGSFKADVLQKFHGCLKKVPSVFKKIKG